MKYESLVKKIIASTVVLFLSQAEAKNLEYAYIYSTQARAVAINDPIALDTNRYITSDLIHSPGSATVKFRDKGTYKITFSISSVQPNQIALYKNGQIVHGSIFGSGNRIQQNTGTIILTLEKNDVIYIGNISSTPINLQTFAGGSQANINAYMIIEQLDA